MSNKKAHFIGLLANVDSSILNMKLDHGFKIESMSDEEGVHLFSALDSLPIIETLHKLSATFSCINSSENKIYFIGKNIEIELGDDYRESSKILMSEVFNFSGKYITGYLRPLVSLMRLFKEGNVCIPLFYFYYLENNKPKRYHKLYTTLHISKEPYTLTDEELPELYNFIQNTKIPFEKPYLQLAFDNFELSYNIHNTNLAFLTLMMSLESLFHPGEQRELRYRISRNTAVLLGGKNNKGSKTIFSNIKKLYDKRSKIVHTGKKNIIKKGDLPQLRHYVRESIKKIYKMDKNKDELLDLLNSSGFDAAL